MSEQSRKASGLFWLLSEKEIVVSEFAYLSGVLWVPYASRCYLERYYRACCMIDWKPCVIVRPSYPGKPQVVVAVVPETRCFPTLVQAAVDAGVAISRLVPRHGFLAGSIEAQRAEAVVSISRSLRLGYDFPFNGRPRQ